MLPTPTLLFELHVHVEHADSLGNTIYGERRIAPIQGGTFLGPRLKGKIESGVDWIIVRPDAVRELDVRMLLRTDDGCLIAMTYRGFRTGTPEILEQLRGGEAVSPENFSYRTAHFFESAGRYAWLNDTIGLGIGAREAGGPVYRVYSLV